MQLNFGDGILLKEFEENIISILLILKYNLKNSKQYMGIIHQI